MFNLLSSLLWQELWVLKDLCKSTINLGLGIEWTNKRAFLVAQWYPPANARDMLLIPGSGRSPGEGNGYPLQHSCLGNPMDRGVCQATVHGVAKSWTWLNDWAHTHFIWEYIPESYYREMWHEVQKANERHILKVAVVGDRDSTQSGPLINK